MASVDEFLILVLVGTTRQQRKSIYAARYVADVGATIPGVKTQLVDPLDYNFPGDGNDPEGKDPRYTELTAKADAFFIVTPEYNHGYPGSLKRMLDSELANYNHKPVALAGTSSGGWGGVRAVELLVPVVREMGLVATSISTYFPRVQNLFDEQGIIHDESGQYDRNVRRAYAELIWMTRTLKNGREKP